MGKITTELQGNFNPLMRDFFECPVCASRKFVYLAPYGGIWCERCNAQVEVEGTCDGPSKIGIRVTTKHCHCSEWREIFDHAFTVLWEYDTGIAWMYYSREGKILRHIDPIPHPKPRA